MGRLEICSGSTPASARRIIRRLEGLAENYEDVGGERLTGELAGLHKFRVGPYRVIFQPLHDERVLVVHAEVVVIFENDTVMPVEVSVR